MNKVQASRRWTRAIAVPGLHPRTALSPTAAVRYLSFTRSDERTVTVNTVIWLNIPETRQPGDIPGTRLKIRWRSRPNEIPEINVSFRTVTEVTIGEDDPPIGRVVRVEPEAIIDSVEVRKNRALVHGSLELLLYYREIGKPRQDSR